MTVRLSDMRGWNDLGLSVMPSLNKPAGNPVTTMTQGDCRKGFRNIVDYATFSPDCEGYTGRKSADGMGNFYGGGYGGGFTSTYDVNAPEFYMFVKKAPLPSP